MSKTLKHLREEYLTDKNGIILNPGKFEGTTLITPFYWEIMLEGEGEIIEIDPSDRLAFNIPDDKNLAAVFVDNNGFVSVDFYASREEAQNAIDDYYGDE